MNAHTLTTLAAAALLSACQTLPPKETVRLASPKSAPSGDFVFISPAIWQGAGSVRDEGAAAFAGSHVNKSTVARAELFATALGCFELYVNDRLVTVSEGDNRADYLRPGATDTYLRRRFLSYDVTALWKNDAKANNVISAFVARSWFSDALGGRSDVKPAFALKARITYTDGSTDMFATDETWVASSETPFRRAGIYWGEIIDGAMPREASVCAARGAAAEVNMSFTGRVVPARGPGVSLRRDLALKPVAAYVYSEAALSADSRNADDRGSVVKSREYELDGDWPSSGIQLDKGETLVVDFGQNAAAIPEICATGKRSVQLVFRGGEALNDDKGEISRGCDGPGGSIYRANLGQLKRDGALVAYMFGDSAGGGEAVRITPSFTYLGYRYGEISATGPVTIHDIESIPVSSVAASMERGTLTTGSKFVNQLISNARWAMLSNWLSVPTDAPQRDTRMGRTGDAQIFAPAAMRFADTYGFLLKWMDDMRDAQSADAAGRYPDIAPRMRLGAEGYGHFGYADAGVAVPWTAWRMTGNKAIIEENWASMCAFVDWQAKTKYKTVAADRRDMGLYQPADWLSSDKFETSSRSAWEHGSLDPKALVYWDYLASCHWYWNTLKMTRMAMALGRERDAARYSAMMREARAHLRAEYFRDSGKLPAFLRDVDTAQAFALQLGLYDDSEARDEAVRALLTSVQKRGTCLGSGLLGTPIAMDAITYAAGRPDIAYTLLLQHKTPGWLNSVDMDATTTWERPDARTKKAGFARSPLNSMNSPAPGAVLEWLYATAAGIQPGEDGGFDREFTLAPITDRRLKSLKATQKTNRGTIVSHWRYEGCLKWTFTIPWGAKAHVIFGDVDKIYEEGTFTLEGK